MLRLIVSICMLLVPSAAFAQRSPASVATLGELSRSLQDLSQKVGASVVQIFVTGYAPPDEDDPQGAGQPTFERSSGSGVIVDADGYIVTNAHVVENATRIEVDLPLPRSAASPADRSSGGAGAPSGRRSSRSIGRPTSRSSRSRRRRCRCCRSAIRTRCGPGSWSSRSAARSGSTRQ